MEPIREKKHGLPEAAYVGTRTVSVTACIESRKKLFVSDEAVTPFVEALRFWVEATVCIVPIYCFMPDHLHVLIQGTSTRSLPKRALEEFKKTTSLWLVDHRPNVHWQKDFHDHVIRRSDDWRRHAFYILNNPVRAGLIEDPYSYPWTGSLGCDMVETLHESAW